MVPKKAFLTPGATQVSWLQLRNLPASTITREVLESLKEKPIGILSKRSNFFKGTSLVSSSCRRAFENSRTTRHSRSLNPKDVSKISPRRAAF